MPRYIVEITNRFELDTDDIRNVADNFEFDSFSNTNAKNVEFLDGTFGYEQVAESEFGKCDNCDNEYELSSRDGRCGGCGNCAKCCDHDNCDKCYQADWDEQGNCEWCGVPNGQVIPSTAD